jgi:putative serine protease PepD
MSQYTPPPPGAGRDEEPTQDLSWTEHTHRYEQPVFQPAPQGATSRPSKGAVAGILAAALLVGGLSGLAGAAGFDAMDDLVGGDATAASPSPGPRVTTASDSADVPATDGSVEQVAASVLPSVVKINVAGPQGSGSGSGVVLSEDGEILTNDHVVAGAEGGRIAVSFDDGSTAPARVVGTDPLTDLAVIQAEDVSGLTPATIGRSGQLDVGEMVVAVGSPFGLEATVTSGIVSALHRPVSVGGSSELATTYPAIQTDAAINPGNSGGPLVNTSGEVVGINSSIRSTSGATGEAGSIGLGFAIPIDNVLPVVDQLRNGETPTHARLGVSVADATSEDGLLSGAGVGSVEPGSAAEEAGLERGDVVVRVDDLPVTDAQSLVATIRGHRPGDEVTLSVVREGGSDPEQVTVTLDSDEGTTAS